MLRYFRAPTPAEHERARIWAAGALAVLALIMVALLVQRPPRFDLTPPPLRADLLPYFATHVGSCRGSLLAAGFQTRIVADLNRTPQCGYRDVVELVQPAAAAPIQTSCALAAGLALWRRDVVEPAAQRRFGQPLATIDPLGGAYACRRIGGRTDGHWSEHAHANAIDIGGFTLADGRTITVLRSWRTPSDESAFLHDIRNGGCRIFQGVLSPDYNRAHANHLHLDMGAYKVCR
ncbi:MAG: extensin family protein [Proteobacteria bacterium]|nr:extensin family protein [Pseudomonadota bacterium]